MSGIGWLVFVLPVLVLISYFAGKAVSQKGQNRILCFFFALSIYVLFAIGIQRGAEVLPQFLPRDAQFLAALIEFVFVGSKQHIFFFVGLAVSIGVLSFTFFLSPKEADPLIVRPQKTQWPYYLVIAFAMISIFFYGKNVAMTENISAPLSKTGFLEESVPYPFVNSLTSIRGKVAYIASDGDSSFVVYDGKKSGKSYRGIQENSLKDIGGKITYLAETDRKWFIVFGEEEIGKQYDGASNPLDIGGTLAYEAERNGKTIIVIGEKEYGNEFNSAWHLVYIQGRPAYFVRKEKDSFVMLDHKQIGGPYKTIRSFQEKNGHLVIIAERGEGTTSKSVLNVDGVEYGAQYDRVSEGGFVGDRLAFTAIKNGQTIIAYRGREIPSVYADANHESSFRVAGNELAFVRIDPQDKTHQLYLGEKPASEKYEAIYQVVFSAAGQIAMEIKQGKDSSVVLNGKRVINGHPAEPLFFAGEKLVVRGYDFLYYGDGRIETTMEEFQDAILVNDKLVIHGTKGRSGSGAYNYILHEE